MGQAIGGGGKGRPVFFVTRNLNLSQARRLPPRPARTLRYPRIMISDDLLSQVRALSATERISLISVLWQTLPLADVPISADEQALLDNRLDDLASRPADQSPWVGALDRLRSGLP